LGADEGMRRGEGVSIGHLTRKKCQPKGWSPTQKAFLRRGENARITRMPKQLHGKLNGCDKGERHKDGGKKKNSLPSQRGDKKKHEKL